MTDEKFKEANSIKWKLRELDDWIDDLDNMLKSGDVPRAVRFCNTPPEVVMAYIRSEYEISKKMRQELAGEFERL